MTSYIEPSHINHTIVLPDFLVLGKNLTYATIVTLCLLYAMYLLVHQDFPDVVDGPRIVIPTVTMSPPQKIPVEHQEPPEKPIEVIRPEVVDLRVDILEYEPTGGGLAVDYIPPTKPTMDGIPALDGQILPFVKVAPVYPASAVTRGIEGYVDVMFDVTEIGTTSNIRVVNYSPSTIFNKSVVKAIQGWKYKPNYVEGKAIKTLNVKERLRFNMDK